MATDGFFSRRTFLRGAGAALAIPWLESLRPLGALGNTVVKGAAAAPVRMGILYFPNGVWTKAFFPEVPGDDYDMPSSLQPLAASRDDFTLISGLDKAASHEGDGHYAKTANFLTGAHVNKTTGKDISAGGISVDQLAAQRLGGATPLPSLELGIDPVVSGIDSLVGYTRLYASYISWRGPGLPVAREINPRAIYERLFGAKDAQGRPLSAGRDPHDNRLLLDMALEDANTLRGRVGRDDQVKLDEYLEAVRSIEKQIDFEERPHTDAWKPPTTPHEVPLPPEQPPRSYAEHVRLMLDLLVMAFWTDSTRVASFMFANDVSQRNFSPIVPGVGGGHHEISHHQNNPEKIRQYQLINRWHVEQFAGVLRKMRSIREGESTLLDNSMLLFGSSMSDGNRHDPANLPLVLAGRAGGTLNPGRYIANAPGTPLCNLYVSMLDRMGVPVPRFGDSTGPLTALD